MTTKKFCDMCNTELGESYAFLFTSDDKQADLCKRCEKIIVMRVRAGRKK